jgi:hypothetical protein
MRHIQKADPAVRRQAILLVVFIAAAGGLLIAGFEHFREPFHEWLTSEPAETARRAKLAMRVSVFVLTVPVIVFAIYLWRLGARVLRARQFPPPGFRVLRDMPVVEGHGATTRGHVIQILAVCLGIGAALLWMFIWWFVQTIGQGKPL